MPHSLYLASHSPRRLELLRQIGLQPTVLPLRRNPPRVDVDETPLPGEAAPDYVQRLACSKACIAARIREGRRLPDWPVLAADTCVVQDGLILGKPRDRAEAADMLRRYSGRTHQVHTAVAIAYHGRLEVAVSLSAVRFCTLSEQDIAAYVASPEPYDKAGGYGIQGLAAKFVEQLEGSYSGVMGLPLHETARLLKALGYDL